LTLGICNFLLKVIVTLPPTVILVILAVITTNLIAFSTLGTGGR
jgi:hypothetical protein